MLQFMHIHALSLKIVVLTYGWGKYGKDASGSTQELDDIAVWCWMISKTVSMQHKPQLRKNRLNWTWSS